MGPISAFPMTPSAPAITISAAGDAAREVKKRKYATSRADEQRLKRRSNRMAQEFQGAMEKSVKRKLNAMSGSQNNRKLGLKVAQFIPGKGLEVAGAQVENDPSIYCSLGLKGEKHVDPLDETFSRIKGRQVSMDFAFKLINDNSKLLDHDKETRVTAINCFRHVNPDSFNYRKTGWSKDVSGDQVVYNLQIVDGGIYSAPNIQSLSVTVTIASPDSGTTATVGLPSFTGVPAPPGVYDACFAISGITLTSGGSGYNFIPSVIFTPGSNVTVHEAASATVDVNVVDGDKALANFNWHKTLGPDATLIRVGDSGATLGETDRAGTYRGSRAGIGPGTLDADSQAAANTLMSPFRYPRDMEIMYSRVNRQLIENYGWMLNPFKFLNPSLNNNASTFSAAPSFGSMNVWSNPKPSLLEFHNVSESEDKLKNSYPAQVNIQNAFVESDQVEQSAGAGYEWHSQFGPGKLSYQFSNDGTNPVCIDICVVGIKKDSPVPVELLQSICKYNYAVHKYANKNATNVNGFQTSTTGPQFIDLDLGSEEWHANAKLPFMPDACFKNPQSYTSATGYDKLSSGDYERLIEAFNQGQKNPFKVVKRDQFIVSSGSSRAWNTTLPSIKYRPQLYEDVEYPMSSGLTSDKEQQIVTTADEYTFVLCVGASGMPKPVEEIYSTTKPVSITDGVVNNAAVDTKTIIDRQPTTCNVSVVGTYKEIIYPCFPQDRTSVNFINGRLTEPYFETAPGVFEPSQEPLNNRVNTVDIAQLGQVVQVAQNGVIGVGALNTEVGA